MQVDQKIVARFDKLLSDALHIRQTKNSGNGGNVRYLGEESVDYELAHQWGISSLNLLVAVFGKDSDPYRKFEALYSRIDAYHPFLQALGILKAAKDDYENGYLFKIRTLVEAEVFDDLLDQSEHLLEAGYYGAAAVVAGAILEDGLRKLCQRNNITLPAKPKLDSMNADLAKAGVYTLLVQKRITLLAEIRNKAAHGQWTQFSEGDARDLVTKVREFMTDHVGS